METNVSVLTEINFPYYQINDLAEDKLKPREKLLKKGAQALDSSELLAIVLNTGTKKEDVFTMADRILQEYGNQILAKQNDPQLLAESMQIPLVKACQVIACFELGCRFYKKNNCGRLIIRSAKQAFEYLKDMRHLPKEQLRGLYLNSRYQLIHDEIISLGSLTANIIHPREVFKPAIVNSAAALIIAHNHPSGSVKPTATDIKVTRQLKEAGNMLSIALLDHIIIAKNKYSCIPINDN